MARKQMKRCPTSLVNMEIYVRTIRHLYKPTNMVKVKGERLAMLHIGEDGNKLDVHSLLGRASFGTTTLENSPPGTENRREKGECGIGASCGSYYLVTLRSCGATTSSARLLEKKKNSSYNLPSPAQTRGLVNPSN